MFPDALTEDDYKMSVVIQAWNEEMLLPPTCACVSLCLACLHTQVIRFSLPTLSAYTCVSLHLALIDIQGMFFVISAQFQGCATLF